jgi:mono/diheme cytochrome c family protein
LFDIIQQMNRRLWPGAIAVWMAAAAWSVTHAASPQAAPAQPAALSTSAGQEAITRYCVSCHNDRLKTAGLSLEKLDAAHATANPELWENVARKVQARAMPPQGARRPDEATYRALETAIEAQLDAEAAAHPNPGAPILHRLNRSEYANAVRDLLALDVDVTSLLPPDDAAYGFDNISDALGVSPSLQERYLSAAAKIAAIAVGDPDVTAGSDTFRIRQDLSQDQHVEGLPLGTIGGTAVRYTFPLDGDYVFQVKLYRTNLNIMRGLEYPHDVEFAIDGRRVYAATIGGPDDLEALFDKPTDTSDAVDARLRVRVPVTAGPHMVSVAFVEDPPVQEPNRLQPFIRSSIDNFDWAGRPHMQTFTITGPFNATGAGDTASRRKIFTCKPTQAGCAETILSSIAHRAYRGPVSAVDRQRIMRIYQEGRKGATFETGIEAALVRILAAPRFVFRVERDPGNAVPGAAYKLNDVELASRLSFFLWSSIPDDELLAAAEQGKLKDPATLDAQVRRMLADPKSQALVDNFAGQWLQLRNVRNVQPNSDLFPDFDDNLRQAFKRETELFFESVVREDRPVTELMTANYTFVNERLAKHYGIPNIHGSRFRRVTLTDERRFGLLGKGSVLAVTSHAERTSPVERGKWILENILGLPVPPPPPIAGAGVFAEPAPGDAPKSMREQMAEHRKNPVCASCHKVMDPIGLSLDNFDVDGSWRTDDAGHAIDATGELVDGSKVDGVVTLRKALMAHPDVFVRTMTEKLLIYALGRGLDARDMPAVRAIMREGAAREYRFSSLVFGIVHSTPFTMRVAQTEVRSQKLEVRTRF